MVSRADEETHDIQTASGLITAATATAAASVVENRDLPIAHSEYSSSSDSNFYPHSYANQFHSPLLPDSPGAKWYYHIGFVWYPNGG